LFGNLPARGDEHGDESPFWHPDAIAVKDVADRGSLELMTADPFKGGVTGLADELMQLGEIMSEPLSNFDLIRFHEALYRSCEMA
jgi:hypothetical protein